MKDCLADNRAKATLTSIVDCLRTSSFSTLELDVLQDRFGARKFNKLIVMEISKEFNGKSERRGENF
jgi:hypothetical protein